MHSTLRRWPLLVIAAPAAVATWSGWVGLAEQVGFGPVRPLPGIVDGFTINSALTLPIGVEAYAAAALYVWIAGAARRPAARRFAAVSGVGALLLGMFGQVAYHLLTVAHYARAPWPIVTAVSCLPVAVLGAAAALWHLLAADSQPEAADNPADSLSALSGQPHTALSAATAERHDGEAADRSDGAPYGPPADNPQTTGPAGLDSHADLSAEKAAFARRLVADLDVDSLPPGIDCLAQAGVMRPESSGHITHRHPEEDYRNRWAARLSGHGLTAAPRQLAPLSVGGSCCVLEKRVSGRSGFTCPGPQAATDRPADNPTDRTDRLSIDEPARLDRAEITDRIARIVGDQERAAGIAAIGCDLAESGQGISRNALRQAGVTGGNRELTDVARLLRSAASDRGVTLTAAV